MKTNEFITEASVMSKPVGYALLLSDGAAGTQFKPFLIDAGIQPNGELKIVSFGPKMVEPIIKLGNGNAVVVLTDVNGKSFTVQGSKSNIEKTFVNPTANKGEIAEGILGAAMFAKFVARNSGGIGTITVDDIWNTVYNLKRSGQDQYSKSVKDTNNKIADQVTFVLRLKSAPYAALTDPAQQANYTELAQSAVAYVNSSHAERYSKYFYTNGKADVIRVISDGVSDETGRKTDIELEILDHKTGNMRRGKLNISLKAGPVKQFGQVGGIEFKSMRELWGRFGINVNNLEAFYTDMSSTDPQGALGTMYEKIADYIAKSVAGDSEVDEYDLVKNVASAINYFATLDDPTVSLVQFGTKGRYKVLRFSSIADKLRAINLSAKYIGNKATPEVHIFDTVSGATLISVRAKRSFNEKGDVYIRNIIEKGPLLDELGSVTK